MEKKVGFLNLEESTKQITKKFLANIGRLSPAFFNKEWGSKEANLKLINAAKILKANPIYLYENPNLDLNKLIIQIRKLVSERKVEIVFIDYLELIIVGELNNKTDTNRTIICNNLKQLAIQLNIVLIVGSQLPRNSYASSINNNRPEYCDLVAKGFIEPNTDTVDSCIDRIILELD
jgi:replicative DNA helicase